MLEFMPIDEFQGKILTKRRISKSRHNYRPLQLNFSASLNNLKANPGKSHILLSTKKPEIVSIDGIPLAASSHEKLVGVTLDSELKFENDITELCLKVSKKLNALCRISSPMSLEKRRTLMKTYIESQFNYCPLI